MAQRLEITRRPDVIEIHLVDKTIDIVTIEDGVLGREYDISEEEVWAWDFLARQSGEYYFHAEFSGVQIYKRNNT